MARAEDIIARIRSCIMRDTGQMPPEAPQLFSDYCAVVENVNQRLERCVQLLRQNLRTEAIHQAEVSPPVLDEAAALEFVEIDAWVSLCSRYNLGFVPGVQLAAATEINEAYPREKQTERLLRVHRRLAIGRGPLRSRIKILRMLSQTEPESPIWGEDLLSFERERHSQIDRELRAAVRRKDGSKLEALHDEVFNEVWLEDPPSAVGDQLQGAYAEIRADYSREKMATLEHQVQSAHHVGDMEQTAALVASWHKAATEVSDQHVSSASITEAQNWLNQTHQQQQAQYAFEQTCNQMQQGLQQNWAPQQLEQTWMQLSQYNQPIPDALSNQYATHMEHGRVQAKRKKGKLVLWMAILLLIGGGGGGTFFYFQHLDGKKEAIQLEIAGLIDDGKFDEAEAKLAELKESDAGHYESDAVQSLVDDVRKERIRDKGRTEEFAKAFAALETAVKEAQKTLDGGGTLKFDATEFDRVRNLARTDKEKGQVAKLESDYQSISNAVLAARRRRLEAQVAVFQKRYKTLDDSFDGSARTPANLESSITKLIEEIKGFVESNTDVPESLSDEAGQILSRTRGLQVRYKAFLAKYRNTNQILTTAKTAIHDPSRLASILNSFVQENPTHPLTSQLKDAAGMELIWKSIEAWNRISPKTSILVDDAKIATARYNSIRSYMTAHSRSPYHSVLSRYRIYLLRAENAQNPRYSPIHDSAYFQYTLQNDVYARLYQIKTKQGTVFYVKNYGGVYPRTSGTSVTFQQILNVQQAENTEHGVPKTYLASFFSSTFARLSPHSLVVSDVQTFLRTYRGRWETRHLDIARYMASRIKTRGNVNPTVAVILLRESLSRANYSGWIDSQDYYKWYSTYVSKLKMKPESWLNYSSTEARTSREAAARALTNLPVDAMASAHRKWLNNTTLTLVQRRPVSIVMADENNRPKYSLDSTGVSLSNGVYEVITKSISLGKTTYRFTPVATVRSGRISQRIALPNVPVGSIVYYRAN